MEPYSQEQWLERLVKTGEWQTRGLYRSPALRYTRSVNLRRLFVTLTEKLPDVSLYGSWDKMGALMNEVAHLDLQWPLFKHRDFKKELRELWTGDDREWRELADRACEKRDPVEYLLKLVEDGVKIEMERVPPLSLLPVNPAESAKLSVPELQKLMVEKREILKKNQEITRKNALLIELGESARDYAKELSYQLFMELQVFRDIIDSTLYEMRQRYRDQLPAYQIHLQ